MSEPNVIPQDFQPKQDNFPFESPFILSSVERAWCHYNNVNIVYIKRRHLEENLKTIAPELGMDEAEQKRFLDYWCCANGDEIRAEGDRYFDLRQRAESWMYRRRPQEQQQSRAQKYANTSKQVTQMIYGLFGQDGAGDNGPATDHPLPPDEQ